MRATGMKSPTENESCSTCGRSEFRVGSPNSMTWPSAALLSTYSAPTTPPPPVRITEIIGWPKWGSAAVVMMLAWSTCEPPNGYGVTNCSSLSGNALAALVSAKAAAAVVASEALANNWSQASSRFPTSRATSSFGPAATELRPLLRCMAAPFDRCTAYFGAPFHTHTLGCGQTIVVRLAGTLEAVLAFLEASICAGA